MAFSVLYHTVDLSTILSGTARAPEPERRVQLVAGANVYNLTHEDPVQFHGYGNMI